MLWWLDHVCMPSAGRIQEMLDNLKKLLDINQMARF